MRCGVFLHFARPSRLGGSCVELANDVIPVIHMRHKRFHAGFGLALSFDDASIIETGTTCWKASEFGVVPMQIVHRRYETILLRLQTQFMNRIPADSADEQHFLALQEAHGLKFE